MQENIKDHIVKLKTNILRARFNLMFMIILTAINILSVVSGNEAFMPFSVTISTFAAKLGVNLSIEQNNDMFLYFGVAISAIVLSAVLLCYYMTKKNALFFVVALGIVAVDTLVLLVIGIGGLFYTSFIVDLLVHIITLVFLVSAIKAQKELGIIDKLSFESLNLSDGDSINEDTENVNRGDLDEYVEDAVEPIVSGEHGSLKAFVVLYEDKAELIINDIVCDSVDTSYSSEYELSAIVNSVDFYFEYKRTYSGETAFLYAGNELLDSFARDFF